jgi:hypothetical protein
MLDQSVTRASDFALYTYMVRSHDYLHALFIRLLTAMQDESPDVRALWDELDHGLLSHMDAEERFVLPVFAHVDRDEALALIREHGLIREQLLELGVAVDLHYIRFERSQEFIEMLRHHAGREENVMYHWASNHLDRTAVAAIKARVATPEPAAARHGSTPS